jgi:hypothetical protein
MSDELALGSVEARVEDEAIVVRAELKNDSDRTIHAYRQARRVLYDPATQTLQVGLTDRAADSTEEGGSFVLPELTTVDPHGSTMIELRLPRVLTRIGGVSAQGAPVIERVPIHEAAEVVLEVGWSDTPFYEDPRAVPGEAHPAVQLRNWERGLAVGRVPIARPATAD